MTLKNICSIFALTAAAVCMNVDAKAQQVKAKTGFQLICESFPQFNGAHPTAKRFSKDSLEVTFTAKGCEMESSYKGADLNRDGRLQLNEITRIDICTGSLEKATFSMVVLDKYQNEFEEYILVPDYAAQEASEDGATTFYSKSLKGDTYSSFPIALKSAANKVKALKF